MAANPISVAAGRTDRSRGSLRYNLGMLPPAMRGLVLAAPLFALTAWAAGQAAELTGRVVDENGAPTPGAKLTLSGGEIPAPITATSDEAGRFFFPPTQPGAYQLSVEKLGFYAFVSRSFLLRLEAVPIEVVLNHLQEFEETVNVVYSPPVIDPAETAAQRTVHAQEIVDMPHPSTHDFRNALPLFPGVIKDNAGRVHLNGGDERQGHYALDGFNIAHPVSGRLDSRVSVDAVRSVRLESSRYSAEHGGGSAGVIALETFQGDDRLRFTATNFLPSFETQEGLHIASWTPRATVSGPIAKRRAWFFNATDLQYDLNVVSQLPSGANTNRNWHGGNAARLQLNLTPRNILTSGFLFNFTEARHLGITPHDPIETSRNSRSRYFFFNLKDQLSLNQGWVVEIGVGLSRWRSREDPMGGQTYVIGPETRSGNYFRKSDQRVERVQVRAGLLSRPLSWRGRHHLRFGLDSDGIGYRQYSERGAEEILREGGARARLISFAGSPSFGRNSSAFSAYVQDRWSPAPPFLIETGLRLDWDQVLRDPLISPRFALTYSPRATGESKFSAGVGVFRDPLDLELLTRSLDQVRSDVYYPRNGLGLAGGPVVSRYVVNERTLKAPRYLNWSLEWEQKLPAAVYFSASFIRRHGRNGWAYDRAAPGFEQEEREVVYELTNRRRDRYSYVEVTARRTFQQKYSCLVSYARSRAASSAVVDFSLENSVFSRQAGGPLGWDTPNRLISWGILPAPRFRRLSIAYFLEWRTGLPYSLVNEEQRLVGAPNSRRFPDYFCLNLHVERRFRFWRYEWAFRAGVNNLTGRDNPTVVNNNVDSFRFGQFAGGRGAVFVGRLRLLGRG